MNARIAVLSVAILAVGSARFAAAEWIPLSAADAEEAVMSRLKAKGAESDTLAEANRSWRGLPPDAEASEVLLEACLALSLVDSDVKKAIAAALTGSTDAVNAAVAELDGADPFSAANTRLLCARIYLDDDRYDEAFALIEPLDAGAVIDPASLTFAKGLAAFQLLKKEEGIKAVDSLLENRDAAPRRYVVLAERLKTRFETLEPDSLYEISRKMNDIGRRLDQGEAGKTVLRLEREVIESLDKMIKKLEDAQKAAQSAQGGNQGGNQSSSPAQKSALLGGKGPGNVTKKNIGAKTGWGDLPPKDRESALQELSRQFPSHYRDVIEQYFRELARKKETPTR